MELRLAASADLPQLWAVFEEIIKDMYAKGISIWDEYYPCQLFPGDIAAGRLYLLYDGETIAAAFALEERSAGEKAVQWPTEPAKVLYFDRFGVNVNYQRRGVGSAALQAAAALAREKGAEVLRLFVVDCNAPAISLYVKNGFIRAEGIYLEEIDEETTLREFGFEKQL